jgi:poly(A) polymerase
VPPDAARLTKLAERLRLSKAEGAYLQAWADAPIVKDDISEAAFDRLLYRHDQTGVAARLKLALAVARSKAEGYFEEMARVARLGKLLERTSNWKKPAFPLNGADALAAGVGAGPRVGELLGKLEQEWLDANFAMNRASLLARLKDLANA